jgi:hypothetical protein
LRISCGSAEICLARIDVDLNFAEDISEGIIGLGLGARCQGKLADRGEHHPASGGAEPDGETAESAPWLAFCC